MHAVQMQGVQNPALVASYTHPQVVRDRTESGLEGTPSERNRAAQNSYQETGNAAPGARPYVDRAADVVMGGRAAPLPRPNAEPVIPKDPTEPAHPKASQAPDAASITGGNPTYNFKGQLNADHASPGRHLDATA